MCCRELKREVAACSMGTAPGEQTVSSCTTHVLITSVTISVSSTPNVSRNAGSAVYGSRAGAGTATTALSPTGSTRSASCCSRSVCNTFLPYVAFSPCELLPFRAVAQNDGCDVTVADRAGDSKPSEPLSSAPRHGTHPWSGECSMNARDSNAKGLVCPPLVAVSPASPWLPFLS